MKYTRTHTHPHALNSYRHPLLLQWLAYFHLHQLHDLREDLDGVGVGDERVHASTVHDGGGHGLQHVSAQVHLLQLLQFGHFTDGTRGKWWVSETCSMQVSE